MMLNASFPIFCFFILPVSGGLNFPGFYSILVLPAYSSIFNFISGQPNPGG